MAENMEALKRQLAEMAKAMGAINARVANRESLDGPPSSDPTFMFPEAKSIISYAVPLGSDWIEDYFGKKDRLTFGHIMFEKYRLIDAIGKAILAVLRTKGFNGVVPSPNGSYRRNAAPVGTLIPDFSHRCAALASGLGTLGWSGNVQIKNHWSAVFLGSLITDVVLPPDEPLSEKLCDNCKLCTLACPLGFMRRDESQTVTLGGREFVCNLKHHHSRCGLSCGGFVGISQDGKWSSWATLRYKVPEDDKKLRDVWIHALNDPDAGYTKRQRFTLTRPERGILDRPQAATQPTCCNCL